MLRKIILEILTKSSCSGTKLWSQVKKQYRCSLQEFDFALTQLKVDGLIRCTNKNWWLTDMAKNNWQKVIN